MSASGGDATQPPSKRPRVTVQAPGRLGDPDMTPGKDPRTHPGVAKYLKVWKKDGLEPAGLPRETPMEDLRKISLLMDQGFKEKFDAVVAKLPPIEGVESSTEVIKGIDGNDITLYISRPKNVKGSLPCFLHIHGGGMALGSAAWAAFQYWRDAAASLGMVVVGVEFRNSGGFLGCHPFPAGLNDCASAVQWCHENKAKLGYSKLIVGGDSGGGNLSLATALKAKKEGKLDQVNGVYSSCPFIHGGWDSSDPTMPSWTENNGYEHNVDTFWFMSALYDPLKKHTRDPLAWPFFAQEEDLKGLPPMVVSVNELDPLRDEGLIFARNAAKAGVQVISITRNGLLHSSEAQALEYIPEVCWAALRDIKKFADSL